MQPRTQTTTRDQPYHSCGVRSSAVWILARAASLLVFTSANAARAHESAADPPLFAPDECIRVIDRDAESALDIAYSVAVDDTELTFGDIAVEDAKTHQFFAFRGALHPLGFNYQLFPFDVASDGKTFPAMLPVWITVADVKRASDAVDPSMATFDASEVPLGAVLENHGDLAGRWLRITADEARVPITIEQAKSSVRFDLSSVEPGLYTIAGYIFSPPYNAWAVRPGVVKIVSASVNPPVAIVDSIHAFAFAYQGRRVTACVDAPKGTTIRGLYRIAERPEAGAIEWLEPQAAPKGKTEFCFHNPRPELTGSVQLLFELEAPDGKITHVVSPDTLTALSGQGVCSPNDDVCCDFDGALTEPPAAGAGGAAASDSAAGAAGTEALRAAAGMTAPPPEPEGPSGRSGCSAAAAGTLGNAAWLALICGLVSGALVRRRR